MGSSPDVSDLEVMLVKAVELLSGCRPVHGGMCPLCGSRMVRREEVSVTEGDGVLVRRHVYGEVCPACGYVLKVVTVGHDGTSIVTVTVSMRLREGV